MSTYAKRCEGNQPVHRDETSYTSKQNLWQKLYQMLCGIQSPPTTDFLDGNGRHTAFTKTALPDQTQNGVVTHGYTNKNGEQFDGYAYDLPYLKPDRSNGGEFEVDFKQPGNFGGYDPDANSRAVSSHKSGQSLQNKRERNDVSPVDKTWEDPEKPAHQNSSQEDFIKEFINNNGKYKDPDPQKVYRSFEPQSEGHQKGLKQEKSSQSQTKEISGSAERAGQPPRSEKHKDVVKQPSFNNDDRKPSFNRDHKCTDTDPPNSTMSSFGQEVVRQPSFNKDYRYTDTNLPKTTNSSVEQQVVRQTSFKDNKYADISPPTTTLGSVAQQVIRQTSFKDNKYAETSPPIPTKGSVAQHVIRQPSFKDNKYADTSPPMPTKGSIAQQVVRQTSFKDNQYADTSPPIPTKGSVAQHVIRQTSFKDNQYADTSPPIPTKGSVAQHVIRQPSFKDNKYADTSPPIPTKGSIAQQIVRQTSFKDNKYADSSPPITTKGSVVQQVVRQPSFKDNKYADTSPPIVTKTTVAQQVVRQTSFKDDQYADTSSSTTTKSSVALQVVRQTSFKDDKYTDTSHPAKTSKGSVGHTLVERQMGVPKPENNNQNQGNTRPSSSIFTNFSGLGQGVQFLAQISVAKPEDTNNDDKNTGQNHMSITKSIEQASKELHKGVRKQDNSNEIHRDTRRDPTKITISGSGQQAALIPLSNQQKGIHMEEEINTKDKFGFSNSFVLKD